MSLTLEIVEGPTGWCCYLNGHRIAGEKPWGGGRVLKRWQITKTDVRDALRARPPICTESQEKT